MEEKFVSVGNYFKEQTFNEVCTILEQGLIVHIGVDCIGHSLNNAVQEDFKRALTEKYQEKIECHCSMGVCSYSYKYKLI